MKVAPVAVAIFVGAVTGYLVMGCAHRQTPGELCQDLCGADPGVYTEGSPDRCACKPRAWCPDQCRGHGGEAAFLHQDGQDACQCADGAFFVGGSP